MRSGRSVLWCFVAAAAFSAGCQDATSTGTESRAVLGTPAATVAAVARTESPAAASSGPAGASAAMPPSLRQAFIAARMAEADERYDVRPGAAEGSLETVHPFQGMAAEFSGRSVRVAAVDPDRAGAPAGVEFSLVGVGRAAALRPVGAARPVAAGNRVEDARGGGIVEWYVHGPLGLEQGFTIERRPVGAGELVVELALGGELRPRSADGGAAVELADESGVSRLRYGDLFAQDAGGAPLIARMETEGARIRLRVEDGAARYPIRIDPLVFLEQQKLTASDGATTDVFGTAVAVSGDTAVIGAASDTIGTNNDQGSVYVFLRTGAAWAQQQKLTAADGAAEDNFGEFVAVAGDTAVVGARRVDVGANADQGSAYVFLRTGVAWAQQQKLTAADGAADDQFGFGVAVSGDSIVVGAHADDIGANSNQGSAYVFLRTGVTWAQQQ
jgi:hypothetical protein